jgi:Rho GTPase-activating protein 1
MHEVSLREASNRMDARNLAIVLCPNLIPSNNFARDVVMCSVPSGSSTPVTSTTGGKTTLGTVIKLCIERYFEIFDEVWDRSETAPPKEAALDNEPGLSPSLDSVLPSPSPSPRQSCFPHEEDEELDDAMLVMPIGPSPSAPNGSSPAPPSAYRHRATNSKASSISAVRSLHTVFGDKGKGTPTIGKAKSMISIETVGPGNSSRKGSIAVGRGTNRKSTGAAVEAIGITASGFFSAPSDAPPSPSLPKDPSTDIHKPQAGS